MNTFSYELDEEQIRAMLQNARLEYDASAWEQFSCMSAGDSPQKVSSLKISGIGLGISRQILVPAFFVAIIAGLSALLFSFVDFRKKDQTEPERLLENKASFVVNEPENKSAPAKSTPIVTHVASKQDSAIPVKTAAAEPKPLPPPVNEAPVETKAQAEQNTRQEATKTLAKQEKKSRKQRRRKRETVEELPSINTSATFNASLNEPEPELKLD